MIKILDVCSGIGGFSLGLEATGGFDTVAFCEYDEFCRKVLNKHWPEVPIYKDLKEIGNEPTRLIQEFDLICGGIPCQPFSLAGKQKGKEDDRHLWPYMYEIIKQKKPTWVIVENVGGFVNVALDDVCLDLETEGYATQSFIIPACGVEAPHRRERIWIIGKYTSEFRQSLVNSDSFRSHEHKTTEEESSGRGSETSIATTSVDVDDSKRNEHIEEIRGGDGEEREDEKRQGRNTVPPGSLAEQVDYGYPIKDMKEAEMWPTPRATSRMAYHESPSPSMIKGTHGWNLNAAITDASSEDPHRMWPTPRANNGNENYETANKRMEKRKKERRVTGGVRNLATEVQMWPTPTQDMTTERKKKYAQGGKPLTMAVQESEMYPTPRASEVAATITMEAALNRVEKTGYKANLEENVALREQEKMFLTPGANEDAAGKPTGKMQRMLGNSPEVRNTGKGTLNPDWVEWLMGYPPGWTDITDLK